MRRDESRRGKHECLRHEGGETDVNVNCSLEQVTPQTATLPVPVNPALVVRSEQAKFPLELLYSFVAFQGAAGDGQVFAFTSVRVGEGVTHVTRLLGVHLAQYCREDVLIISPGDLQRLTPPDVEQIEVIGRKAGPGVWTVPVELPQRDEETVTHTGDLWAVLRRRFRYVLLDCTALECSADVLSLAPRIDGTVLVVRSGYATKLEIQKAARLLSLGRAPFVGCILNQRTYPVPGFLYRFL